MNLSKGAQSILMFCVVNNLLLWIRLVSVMSWRNVTVVDMIAILINLTVFIFIVLHRTIM